MMVLIGSLSASAAAITTATITTKVMRLINAISFPKSKTPQSRRILRGIPSPILLT